MRESTATATRRSPAAPVRGIGTRSVRGTGAASTRADAARTRGSVGGARTRGSAGRAGGPATDPTGYAVEGANALAPSRRSAPADQRPARRLRVAPPVPVSAPRAPFVALVLFLVVAGVLGILVLNTKIAENAFHLNDLQQQQAALNEQEQQLSDQLADESSPTSLAAAARKLGLVPAGAPAFIQLPDGRVIGVPQPANGSPSVTGAQAGSGH